VDAKIFLSDPYPQSWVTDPDYQLIRGPAGSESYLDIVAIEKKYCQIPGKYGSKSLNVIKDWTFQSQFIRDPPASDLKYCKTGEINRSGPDWIRKLERNKKCLGTWRRGAQSPGTSHRRRSRTRTRKSRTFAGAAEGRDRVQKRSRPRCHPREREENWLMRNRPRRYLPGRWKTN
jgi:hypothetical protein